MGRKKDILAKVLCAVMAVSLIAGLMPSEVAAADIPKYHDIPAYQYKDVYETETVTIKGLPVEEVTNSTVNPIITQSVKKPVKFILFNSTKQEIEQEIMSREDGTLPDLDLIKNHTYIIFLEDSEYRMNNVYIWVNGNKIVDIKDFEAANYTYNYPEVTSLHLYKRQTTEPEPASERRVRITPKIKLKSGGSMFGIKFKLVSDVETIECKSGFEGETQLSDSKLSVRLLEDVTYMVTVEDETYDVESFPIAVKDKSEYGAGKYCYDHSSCARVDEIYLVKKKDAHNNDKIVTSLSGKTTVTGINFKDLLIVDKELDANSIGELNGKDCDVIDIKVINPHRGEVSKLAAGDFKVTETVGEKRVVENVYYIDGENNLQELEFEQVDNKVNFTMNSLSLYPVVIEYNAIKEALNEAIGEAAELDGEDFTEESWKAYSDAIAQANILKGDPNSTDIELQEALQIIEETKSSLVIPDGVTEETKSALNVAIKGISEFNETDYTADSWKKYVDAVEAAKVLATKKYTTNTKCQTAIKAVENAKKSLILRETNQEIKVTGISVGASPSKKIAAGKKVQITAKIAPENATNKTVEWKTSNKKYATVNSNGKVTTKKAGAGKTVTVTAIAKDGSSKKATCKIKIMKNAVKSISLKAKKTAMAGKKLTVKATVKTTGKSANKALKWATSNSKYATVNSKGKVTLKKAGKGKTVKITAKAIDGSGKKKTIKIKIK